MFHFIVLVNLLGWIEMPGFLLHSRFLDDVVGLTRMIGKGNGNINSIFFWDVQSTCVHILYTSYGWFVVWLID